MKSYYFCSAIVLRLILLLQDFESIFDYSLRNASPVCEWHSAQFLVTSLNDLIMIITSSGSDINNTP